MEALSLRMRAHGFAWSISALAFVLGMLAVAAADIDAIWLFSGLSLVLLCALVSRVLAASVTSDITRVHALAMFDAITGLSNRETFRRKADAVLHGLPDSQQAALVFLDLDNFKAVNDTLGHACGDQLLAIVAERLRTATAQEEVLIGRLAGDEFTLLFAQIAGVECATHMAKLILAALKAPIDIAGHRLTIGASLGIAMRPNAGRSLTELMRAADFAMYHAKDMGRNQFQFFDEALGKKLEDRLRLGTELRAAIDCNEFTLAFQPQVSLVDGSVVVVEALLRWNHPVQGLLPPSSFISTAIENGLVVEIGAWGMQAIGETLASWSKLDLAPRLSVDVTMRQISRTDFFGDVRQSLARNGASIGMLELELSEAAAMECSEQFIAELEVLRAEGAVVTLDDFGAGHSHLARLRCFPVDRIKIHRNLIADLVTNAETRSVVQSLVGLIHGLGCEAVAAGAKDPAQIELLRVMGCDAVQGRGVAPAMSEADYVLWRGKEASARSITNV